MTNEPPVGQEWFWLVNAPDHNNDIIIMAFDWLTVPTTANQIIEPPVVNSRGDLLWWMILIG